MTTTDAEAIIASIKSSRKYRHMHAETIRAVVEAELGRYRSPKQAEKAARERLHHILAPYIGEPDYDAAEADLRAAFRDGVQAAVRAACARILNTHVSTRERLPIAERFYAEIFRLTGRPAALLDIACALNPLTFPWMGLPTTTRYYAYDIHERRIDFINTYFTLQGLPALAKLQDVALHPPQEPGDVALFLKELPRFEQNYGGGLALLDALRVRYVVVSFPTVSFHGGRSLTSHYRAFFRDFLAARPWTAQEIAFEQELVFCIDKGG